jgi:hypothetical protein
MEDLWIIAKKTHEDIEGIIVQLKYPTKFAICGLCFFVHVVEYTIVVEKPFICSCKNNYVITHQ